MWQAIHDNNTWRNNQVDQLAEVCNYNLIIFLSEISERYLTSLYQQQSCCSYLFLFYICFSTMYEAIRRIQSGPSWRINQNERNEANAFLVTYIDNIFVASDSDIWLTKLNGNSTLRFKGSISLSCVIVKLLIATLLDPDVKLTFCSTVALWDVTFSITIFWVKLG